MNELFKIFWTHCAQIRMNTILDKLETMTELEIVSILKALSRKKKM